MNAHGPILVPLDGSELAEGAIPIAVKIAAAERTHLVLMSVWEEPGSGTPAGVSMEMEARAREYFETYLHGIRDRLQRPEIRTVALCGDPSDSILQTAAEIDARMIVIASHGRSGFNRWLYGSTASRLLRASRIPLLVAGPAALRRAETTGIVHVMVPLDGSPLSESAIEAGVHFAGAFNAHLSLVRAVPWAYETYPYAGAATYIQSLDNDLETAARIYIEKRVGLLAPGVEARGQVLRGFAAQALLDFEESAGVDLVVMTTHARGGLARVALGSTAERMLHGRAPALFLRPEGAPKRDRDKDRKVEIS